MSSLAARICLGPPATSGPLGPDTHRSSSVRCPFTSTQAAAPSFSWTVVISLPPGVEGISPVRGGSRTAGLVPAPPGRRPPPAPPRWGPRGYQGPRLPQPGASPRPPPAGRPASGPRRDPQLPHRHPDSGSGCPVLSEQMTLARPRVSPRAASSRWPPVRHRPRASTMVTMAGRPLRDGGHPPGTAVRNMRYVLPLEQPHPEHDSAWRHRKGEGY